MQTLVWPEFFNFSFYRPSLPNFLEIEKKLKEIFFNFIFYFPPTHVSTVLEFNYVLFCLSTAARLIKLPPVTAPGEILSF